MKKFLKKNRWLIASVFVVASAVTGIDLTPVQKAVEDTINDSTLVRHSTDELGDSIVCDSLCYQPQTVSHEK